MADPNASLTPEKRLLNLIESGGKGGAVPAAAPGTPEKVEAAAAVPKVKGPKLSAQLVKEKANLLFLNFKNRFGLKTATKTARIALGFLVLLTIFNAVFEMKMAGHDPLAGLDAPERKITQIDVDEPAFDPGLIQSTDSRNIFLPFSKREELQAVKPDSSAGRLAELTKNLKLTGISYNPEDPKMAYCMIEDLQKNITLFLHVGDNISGMKIGKINEESIELHYENEKIEIH